MRPKQQGKIWQCWVKKQRFYQLFVSLISAGTLDSGRKSQSPLFRMGVGVWVGGGAVISND